MSFSPIMTISIPQYLAQCRCGILPLSIETGMWGNIPLEDRICKMCDSLAVEDEYHFIFHCSLYKNIRDPFLHHVGNTIWMGSPFFHP